MYHAEEDISTRLNGHRGIRLPPRSWEDYSLDMVVVRKRRQYVAVVLTLTFLRVDVHYSEDAPKIYDEHNQQNVYVMMS